MLKNKDLQMDDKNNIKKIQSFIDEKLHEIRKHQDDGLPDAYFEGMLDGILMVNQFVDSECA